MDVKELVKKYEALEKEFYHRWSEMVMQVNTGKYNDEKFLKMKESMDKVLEFGKKKIKILN